MYTIQRASKGSLSIPLLVLFAFCMLLVCIPGHRTPTKLLLLFALSSIASYVITQTNSGDPVVDLGLGSALLTQILGALDALFLTDPDALVNLHSPHSGRITQKPLKERIRWAFNLYTNVRGVGWAHEPPALPPAPAPHTPTRTFVVGRLVHGAFCALAEFACYVLLASNPALNTPGVAAFSGAPFVWRVLGTLAFGGAAAARIYGASCLVSAIIVGLGFSTPDRWPRLFGSPLDAWTLRRFWRDVWHQMLRKNLIATSEFILTTFLFLSPPRASSSKPSPSSRHIPTPHHRTRLHSLLLTLTAFLISGLVHVGGEWMLLGVPGYGALTFFCLQGVGVALEVATSSLWKWYFGVGVAAQSNGSNGSGNANGNGKAKATNGITSAVKPTLSIPLRILGHLWVVAFFACSLPYMIDPLVGFDMFVDPRFDLGSRLRLWA